METLTALFDSCVLYPAPLRDLLMHLALMGLFRARWTDTIHDEWINNLLEKEPHRDRERLTRTRELMNRAVLDCLVMGYEDLIPSISLPDPNDRHVLAAAIRGQADLIITFNLKDFPVEVLRQYGIEAQHPDDFVTNQINLNPAAVFEAVKRQRENLKNPPQSPEQLLETLEKQGLTQTVASLREAVNLL